jgi:transketolase
MYQTGPTERMMALEPLADKWKSFGWSVKTIDGHNMEEIVDTLESAPFEKERPSAIISNTIKGKGVSFIMHHHMARFNEERLHAALKELGEPILP